MVACWAQASIQPDDPGEARHSARLRTRSYRSDQQYKEIRYVDQFLTSEYYLKLQECDEVRSGATPAG